MFPILVEQDTSNRLRRVVLCCVDPTMYFTVFRKQRGNRVLVGIPFRAIAGPAYSTTDIHIVPQCIKAKGASLKGFYYLASPQVPTRDRFHSDTPKSLQSCLKMAVTSGSQIFQFVGDTAAGQNVALNASYKLDDVKRAVGMAMHVGQPEGEPSVPRFQDLCCPPSGGIHLPEADLLLQGSAFTPAQTVSKSF